MSFQVRTRFACLWLVVVVVCGLTIQTCAQVGSRKSKQTKSRVSRRAAVYEDAEVRIVIPRAWTVVTSDGSGTGPFVNLGSSVVDAEGKVLLTKAGYTLGIAYNTEQASGIEGGRFIEVFNIPWTDADDAWTCSLYLTGNPQPASRVLIFINLTANTGDPKVQENCGIAKDLGHWTSDHKDLVGEQRWFAGYFTTAPGRWFFKSDGSGCGEKAYTLTTWAKRPEDLPNFDDPALVEIVKEAIHIVDSIHYKRCPPA